MKVWDALEDVMEEQKPILRLPVALLWMALGTVCTVCTVFTSRSRCVTANKKKMQSFATEMGFQRVLL